MNEHRPLQLVPDDELLRRLADLMRHSRRTEADLVAHIAEVDARRLYAREATPSMFAYCTEVLHLAGAEAYLRIAAARASREHPMLLAMLGDGRLHLTAIAKLAPHLTRDNAESLLKRATHGSKREVEALVAELSPKPDVAATMRKLPEGRGTQPAGRSPEPDGVAASVDSVGANRFAAAELRPDGVGPPERSGQSVGDRPDGARSATETGLQLRPDGVDAAAVRTSGPAVVQTLSPGRYKVQFTASAELRQKLERLQALMRSRLPEGDLAAIIEAAVTEKLERLEARRFARTKGLRKAQSRALASVGQAVKARPSSRHIPAAVRRAVCERDGNQCRFVSNGRRCTERHRLEFHHRHPFGHGGGHRPENISLMCRAHNDYLAGHDYGERVSTAHGRADWRRAAPAAKAPAP